MSDKKKENMPGKTREDILAEREAKKLAKQAKKTKESRHISKENPSDVTIADIKPAAIQSQKSIITDDAQNKSKESVLAGRAAKKQARQEAKGKERSNKDVKAVSSSELEVPKEQTTEALQSVENKKMAEPKAAGEKSPITSITSNENKLPEKSKSQLKAERRAKQEAQRAKKTEIATSLTKKLETSIKSKEEISKKENIVVKPKKAVVIGDSSHRVKLFAHLYALTDLKSSVLKGVENVHPSISWLGAQYRNRVICGSNVRCLALLCALKRVIADYKPSVKEDISRGLEAELTRIMAFLHLCRPVSVSMSNAVKHLKHQITNTRGPETEAKEELLDWVETYVKDQLEKAAEAISISVRGKISNGDVILTYSCSSLVEKILIAAAKDNISFRVIVVDGRPWLEGREMLRRLILAGIHCTYILVNAVSFVMPEVTKILLGAHALLANGYVMSRSGASQVALLGRAMNVPVLVCCETHKFSERVQTDSFVYNELGNPDELLRKTSPLVTPLNLVYDVTPPDLVSAVVTELAFLPCTSVPVILRIK